MVVVDLLRFFLAEYAGILFISLLFRIIFFGSDLYSFFFYLGLLLFISYLCVFVVLYLVSVMISGCIWLGGDFCLFH